MLDKLSQLKKILLQSIYDSAEDLVTTHAAALAFYAIFSITPLLIILLWFSALFLGEQASRVQLEAYLSGMIGADFSESLLNLLYRTQESRSSVGLVSSVITIGTLLFAATTLIAQLKLSFNEIWGIKEYHVNSLKLMLIDRATSFLTVVLLGLLFIASILLEAILGFFETSIISMIPLQLVDQLQLGNRLFTVLITFVFFGLIFRQVPDLQVPWRSIAVGALFTTLLFLPGKYLVGLYLSSDAIGAGYRVAGSFVLFLIWVYYNTIIILVGAEFTAAFNTHMGYSVKTAKHVSIGGKQSL